MKKYFVTLLSVALLLLLIGCNQTPPDTPDNTTKNSTENSTVNTTENSTVNTTENTTGNSAVNATENSQNEGALLVDIYLCNDVYRTKDTPTHGSGTIDLPMTQDVLEIKDYELLLCRDKCEPTTIVRLASQGYAAVYRVISDGELDGNFKTLKFKMVIPEPMVEDLKQQGVYEDTIERLESNYYYLLVLDETHYAYIHLGRIAGAEKVENEAALADSIVKNAEINFES